MHSLSVRAAHRIAMSYRVQLYACEEATALQRQQAEQRFCQALQAHLGDAELVAPVYRAYLRLVSTYGEQPDLEALTPAEREIFTQWQEAESAALTAALGPHRYLDDAQFVIRLD